MPTKNINDINQLTLSDIQKRIEELSELDDLEYDPIRKKEATHLGISLKTLNQAVKKQRVKNQTPTKFKRKQTFTKNRPKLEAWEFDLIRQHTEEGKSQILWRVHNAILILKNDPKWKDRIKMDVFANQIYLDSERWEDYHTTQLKQWFEKHWIQAKVTNDIINEAVEIVAKSNETHPIKERLDSLVWDGVTRIPYFFSDYCHSPDWVEHQDYLKAVAKSFFISAVARIYDAGCKVDTMLILEGIQGAMKSELFLILFGKQHHIEISESVGSSNFYQSLSGVWCAEFGELSALSKADSEKVKQVITQRQDTYRMPYARYFKTCDRQCIFTGTTNKDHYLKDETGGRRFLPVRCGNRINIERIQEILDQLWAEAVARYKDGQTWWDIPEAEFHQENRSVPDSWEDYIADYIQLKHKTEITIRELLADSLSLDTSKQDRSAQIRVGMILRRLGWKPKKGLHRPRIYEAPKEINDNDKVSFDNIPF